MSDFISLTCPACGAKMDLAPNSGRVKCSYCGHEQIIQRTGMTPPPLPPIDLIRMQTDMEKNTAELAIARLEKEIPIMIMARQKFAQDYLMAKPKRNPWGLGAFIWGILVALAMVLEIFSGEPFGNIALFWIIGAIIGLLPGWLGWRYLFRRYPPKLKAWLVQYNATLQNYNQKIGKAEADLLINRSIVSS